MKKRILLVGASGFVGSTLVRRAASRGGYILVAGVRNETYAAGLGQNTLQLDVTQRENLALKLANIRPDVVINASAYGVQPSQRSSEQAMSVNTAGALNLMNAAAEAGCGRFIQLGSCSEYGDREGRVDEDMAPTPTTLYGATKAAASVLLQERGSSLGVETLILRLFNLWGEGEAPHRLFPAVVSACREARPLDLTEGSQLKDYSFVDDVADWILVLAAKPERTGVRVVNIASGTSRPLREFASEIAARFGGEKLLRFGAKPVRTHEARTQVPSLNALEELLPGRQITPVATALDRVLDRVLGPIGARERPAQ